MCAAFDARRKIIVNELNSVPGFTCLMPKGAFYAFANVTGTGSSSKELEERFLYEAGVASLSGASFGEFGEGYVRLTYANSQDNIKQAIDKLDKMVRAI